MDRSWRLPPALRVLDERRATGGLAQGVLFLVHPGPSLLVTLVTVAAAALAARGSLSGAVAVRLVLLMLAAQFAIGATNDIADVRADAAGKPWKPLVRRSVSPRAARGLAAGCVALSLSAAWSLGPAVLTVTAIGLAAGLAYDLALKRTPLSWVAWWAGFAAVPLVACTAAGRFTRALLWTVPLALCLSVALHCANAGPDIAGDRDAGVSSLPVMLGTAPTTTVALLGLPVTALITAVLFMPLHQSGPWLPIAWGVVVTVSITAWLTRRRATLRFPLLAGGSAVLAIAWLAALPV